MKSLSAAASIALALTLAGCASTNQTRVVSSSARTVSVLSFKGMAEAQKMADTECQKHGRLARWVSGDVTYIFDCVL